MYFNIFYQLNVNTFTASNCKMKKNNIGIFINPIVTLGSRLVYV